jgi:predicted anti-sigma-YlaC factor YlaD
MTDCPRVEIRDLLPDLLAGSLDGGTRARVEEHLRGCAECAAELALLGRARVALSRAPAVDAARIAAAVHSPRQARLPRTRQNLWRVAAMAAGIVLMVAGALWLTLARPSVTPPVAQQPATPASERVVSPAGVAAAASGQTRVAGTPRQAAPSTVAPEPAEVAVAVALGEDELGDAELEALLRDIRGFDGLPDADPGDLLGVPATDGEVQR